MGKARRRPGERARWDHPRDHLELEHARPHGRVLLAEPSRLVGLDVEDADAAQPAARIAERAGCNQMTRLVELGQMIQVAVVNRGLRLLIELRRLRRRGQEHYGEAIELHAAMLVGKGW